MIPARVTPNTEAKRAIIAELPNIPDRDLSRLVPEIARKQAECRPNSVNFA